MALGNTAHIEITAGTSQLPSALRNAANMMRGFATSAMNAVKGIGKIPQWGGQAIGHFAGSVAMRGMDLVVDQGKDLLDFERQLVAFGIDIRKVPSQMGDVRASIRGISSDTGIAAIDVLKAARSYVDLAGAEQFSIEKMSLIARAARASGAGVQEMAELMFTLTENMKVPPGELEDTIGGIINQAKDGSIHFRELAHELVALGPVYAQFGVKGREGANQLAGMMQIARRGFGSASEAGTGVLRILRSIPQHASKFRKFGVEVFQPGSKNDLQNFLGIVKQIKTSKLSLDREALIKAFGRTEGERFYQLLKDATEQYEKLLDAGRSNGVVAKDLATVSESSAGRIDAAMQRAKNTIAAAFTPERVEAFAGAVDSAVDKLEPMLKIMEGIGAVMGAFYHTGQAIRGALTPGTSVLAPTTIDDAKAYAAQHGMSTEDAYRELQSQHSARMRVTQQLQDLTPDGRATKEANEAAVAAKFAGKDTPGWQGTRAAGEQYIEAAHLTPETVDEIHRRVMAASVDSAISSGKGFSSRGPASELAMFNSAIESRRNPSIENLGESMKALGPIIRDAIREGMARAQNVFKVDGNPLALAVDNASSRRSKP